MDFSREDRGDKPHHGLYNQGATCYLNCVLQVLFMTKDFRAAVERLEEDLLKTLFRDLKSGPARTTQITNKLGIDRVYEQRDAAEYLVKILGLTSPEASQIFHGVLTDQTKCSACSAETNFDGPFWHLPLPLLDSYGRHYGVVDGIEEFFRASKCSGENQMYCDDCDAKTDVTVKSVMKHHPEVLILLLKRFYFDYHHMTYVKNCCTVDVPCTLQIPENQMYELYAVVDHSGNLRSGHYTARIKDDERWYEFNDSTVRLLRYQPFQVDNFEISSDAYLLFYRKRNDNCDQDITELSPGDLLPATTDTDDQCQGAVQMREEEEAGGASQDLDDTSVAVSTNENEETGSEDVVRPEGVRLPPDPKYNVEDEDNRVYARQRTPYKQQENMDVMNSTLQNGDEDKLITDNKEDMGGNADDQAEMREGQVEDDVKDQDKESGSLDDVGQRRPQEGLEGNDLHNTSNINQSDRVSDMSVRQECPEQVCVDMQRDEDVRRAEDAQTEGREQSEIREASTRHFNRETESEGLRDVSQNVNEDLRDTQKIGQDYGLKAVTDDREQRNEERMEIYDIVGKEGTTGVDDRQIKHDQCIQNFIRADDRKQNVTEDDQGLKRRSSGRDEIWEQKKEEEKRDVQRVEQQQRADDERAKWSVERQTKEQGNERDENILNGADSSAWQAGSAGSRRVGRVGRAGPQDNEHAVEGRLDSEKMSSSEVMRAEGEIKESPGGTLRSPEIKHRSIEEPSWQDSLLGGVSRLRLSKPCQSQGTERSSNADLFYRKGNDDCDQDITELSPPGDLLPATTDTDDQCQGAVQMREEEEAGGTSQDLDDTSVAVSTNENEETGSEDVVRLEGVRLPPDPKYNVEDEDNRVYARQRTPYKQQENMDVMNSTLQNGDEDKLITDNKEDMGGNADDQAEMREGQVEDDVKDQDKDSGSLDDVRQRRPQEGLEGNDLHNTSNINQSDRVGDMSVRQECPEQVCVDMQRDEDVRRAEDAQTEGREQSEIREASTRHFNRETESEGLRDVSQNVNEDLRDTQKIGQDYGLKAVTDDREQRNEERMEIYDIVGKEGTTGVDDRQIKHDQCIQNFIRADDRKQNVTEDDQGLKRRSSGRDEIWEQKKEEEKRDVQRVEQQQRADDERAKWSVERQTKEQGNERDENILNGADSSAWQAGSAGSRRVGRVGRAGPQDNEHAVEGRLDSEKMSSSEVMRAEGEIKESPGGTLRSPEIKHRSIEEPSWQDSLLEGVSRLRLSEPCQSQGTERSSNADLFYRKGNDDCDQDITELSPPGDLLPATTDTDDQCQGAVQMREEEEAGGTSQDLDDTSVAVSTNENEETGSEDVVLTPGGVRWQPDPKYNVEDEDNRVYARQRTPYKQQENMDVMNSTLQNGDEDKLITDNKEDMGGNADDQAEMREGQVEDDVKDQDKESGSLDDVGQRRPQEGLEGNDMHNTSNINQSDRVGDMSVRQECPEQVFVDMQRDEDVRRDEDAQSEVMRAEGEIKESPGGTLRSPEIKHRSIEESSQQDSLSNKLSGLRLSEPCQSQGTAEPVGAQQENKTKSILYSNTKKEKKHPMLKGFNMKRKRKASGHHESSSEGKKRRRKTLMCFSCIGPKNAELTSDSE